MLSYIDIMVGASQASMSPYQLTIIVSGIAFHEQVSAPQLACNINLGPNRLELRR